MMRRFWRVVLRPSWWRASLASWWLLLSTTLAYGADLVLIQRHGDRAVGAWQLDVAARLYGMDVRKLGVEERDRSVLLRALQQPQTVAVILTAEALATLNAGEILRALERGRTRVPLLVVGIQPTTEAGPLRQWSTGAVVGCKGPIEVPSPGFYVASDLTAVTRQLAGQRLPFPSEKFCRLDLDVARRPQVILSIDVGGQGMPVFVRTQTDDQHEIFFQSTLDSLVGTPPTKSWPTVSDVFPAIAPLALFIRYAAGDVGWHAVGHYANFTVDDPWLTEPYGHLTYKGLLEQMKRHNFHTTIAFIPWNYDRSDPAVAVLFREHPDRFSLAIHGNNHDHLEFPNYDQRPLDIQVANLRQAVARMERLRALTQLSYDRVMIFPHHISPAGTLGALKNHNYLATMNSTNVPLDMPRPADPLFGLRATSVTFKNFPSVRRSSVDVPISEADIAIDAFLGNPLLFYGHHTSFASGIGAFNHLADAVNRIQPDTRWRNLGDIARHLYVQRRIGPGRYEVFAYSSAITLDNPATRETEFLVRRDEDVGVPIRSVTVDGQPARYLVSDQVLTMEVAVPPESSRRVVIEYASDVDLRAVDVGKYSLRVKALRYLSDFRDLVLPRIPLGQKAVEMYYRRRPGTLATTTLVTILVLVGLGFFRARRRRRAGPDH